VFGESISDILAQETARKFPVTKDWVTVLYREADQDDEDFQNAPGAKTPADTDDTFYMNLIAQSPQPFAGQFDWEFFVCHEVFGKTVRGMTHNKVDLQGHGIVHSVVNSSELLLPTNQPLQKLEKAMVLGVVHEFTESSSHAQHVPDIQAFSASVDDVQKVAGTAKDILTTATTVWTIGNAILSLF
jgi:hypothetical protein